MRPLNAAGHGGARRTERLDLGIILAQRFVIFSPHTVFLRLDATKGHRNSRQIEQAGDSAVPAPAHLARPARRHRRRWKQEGVDRPARGRERRRGEPPLEEELLIVLLGPVQLPRLVRRARSRGREAEVWEERLVDGRESAEDVFGTILWVLEYVREAFIRGDDANAPR